MKKLTFVEGVAACLAYLLCKYARRSFHALNTPSAGTLLSFARAAGKHLKEFKTLVAFGVFCPASLGTVRASDLDL
ncbi:hypothetical protein [Paenibacillus sp. An7]|uniref:hypothetical protein n=1 Tax=Paenibacillus sp. An7 TaxID=2689577 RepID=UPI00135B12EC|nr:hypothetical protein [Paenibacillus sp. An7]